MSTPFNYKHLYYFWVVAKEGGMSKAADKLDMAVQTVSAQVRELERDLGCELLKPAGRGLALTEAGRQFMPAVRDVFFALDSGVQTLQEGKRLKSERLTLATSPLLAGTVVPAVIAKFQEQFPNVDVTLVDVPVDQVVSQVRESKADFGICTADAALTDLITQVLYQDTLMLAFNPDHPMAERAQAKWSDLIDQPLILLNPGTGMRRLTDQALSEFTLRLKPAFEVANIQTAIGLVAAGLGLSILPAYSLARATGGQVRAIALTDPVVSREIVALCTRARPFSMAAEAFLKLFKESAK
jgi:DNA-binding transcriptional LysR family regulator